MKYMTLGHDWAFDMEIDFNGIVKIKSRLNDGSFIA